ncbi:MAG: hypothetical protein JSW43_13420 [Gemmatimonadota bacterium]|nr:MAG: hypothetical protein JSW43_13420 [Gemmatimonadota bacterium]
MVIFEVWPVWAAAILIFSLRIIDVSLGTLRTISVVHGRRVVSVLLGFVEVLIWITAVSQAILGVQEEPLLVVAYAAGFAVGNGAGIALERWLALGSCVVRMITSGNGVELAERLRTLGQTVTAFRGEGSDGPRTLLFTACARRDLPRVIAAARAADPGLFYTVERFTTADYATPLPGPTGWRAVLKKK